MVDLWATWGGPWYCYGWGYTGSDGWISFTVTLSSRPKIWNLRLFKPWQYGYNCVKAYSYCGGWVSPYDKETIRFTYYKPPGNYTSNYWEVVPK